MRSGDSGQEPGIRKSGNSEIQNQKIKRSDNQRYTGLLTRAAPTLNQNAPSKMAAMKINTASSTSTLTLSARYMTGAPGREHHTRAGPESEATFVLQSRTPR
jgi:hypothetical protein